MGRDLDFDERTADVVGRYCQDYASYISQKVDLEVISITLVPSRKGEMYERMVEDRRREMAEEMGEKVREMLGDCFGLYLLEGRTYFLHRLHEGVLVALSKFDKVSVEVASMMTSKGLLIPDQGGLSKSKSQPNCIACNRPLITKVPRLVQEAYKLVEDGEEEGESKMFVRKVRSEKVIRANIKDLLN